MRLIAQFFILVLLLAAAYVVLRPAPPIEPAPVPAANGPAADKPAPQQESTPRPSAPRVPERPHPADVPSQPASRPADAPSEPDEATQPSTRPKPAGNFTKFRLSSPQVEDVTIRQRDGQVAFQGTVDLTPTLTRIERGQRLRFPDDGIVFQNRERRLPVRPSGYYHEYVHPTPELHGPGPQRVVVGAGGEVYYTSDHYRTFKQL